MCPQSPMRLYPADQTMTIAIGWQASHTPKKHKAYFMFNDTAVELAGGVIIGFNGKDVPHGWWSRFSEKWPFYIAYMVEHP